VLLTARIFAVLTVKKYPFSLGKNTKKHTNFSRMEDFFCFLGLRKQLLEVGKFLQGFEEFVPTSSLLKLCKQVSPGKLGKC